MIVKANKDFLAVLLEKDIYPSNIKEGDLFNTEENISLKYAIQYRDLGWMYDIKKAKPKNKKEPKGNKENKE